MAPRARRIVADSDVLIQVLRGDAVTAGALQRCLAAGRKVVVTPVTVAEVRAGVRRGEEARVALFLDAFDCLRVDRAIGETAGDFLRRYSASHDVELGDALIAACAAVEGCQLWTLNRKHYPMRAIRFFAG
ncbi:MAG TPA: type II toxin-antitoxin system VapC family toxin [Polyangia bacterium]|jgi:hypothetical protein